MRVSPPGPEAVGPAGNGGKVRPCLSAGKSVGHEAGGCRGGAFAEGPLPPVAASRPRLCLLGSGKAGGIRARYPGRGAVHCGAGGEVQERPSLETEAL